MLPNLDPTFSILVGTVFLLLLELTYPFILLGSSIRLAVKQRIDWNGPDDPENPFNWSRKYKWLITLTTCFISILTGLPAGAYSAGNDAMEREFHVSNSPFPYLSFATASWNMGAALFPLLFVPLTENTGRMPGYYASYILFLIWLIPSATAPNFATLVVTRFFGGGASSVSINLVGGSITDIWKGERDRSLPMSIFGMTSVIGIALGPFVGGAIISGLNWRWIYWVQLIADAGLLPIFAVILRETRGDRILANRAKKLRKQGRTNAYAKSELNKASIIEQLKISFMRPTKMLTTEFVVIAFTLWVSFAWGVLFLFQSSVAQVFSALYGWSTFPTTIVQLAISVGAIIATIVNPIQDWLYLRSAARNEEEPGRPIPEARLYFAVPGSLIFTAGLFWYGWSSYKSLPWIVPALGVGCVGFGIYQIYMATVNYLSDAYEKYTASALSAASLGRNTFGAFLPLASPQLYSNLGFQWASSLLGFLALILSAAPIILLWKGPVLRQMSPFMSESTYDEGEAEVRRNSYASRRTLPRQQSAGILPFGARRTPGATPAGSQRGSVV
ncbi:putative MFS multidrug transporter [Teratosphaeria nubilosa]|uniref:Putative MFS multidrug transporter n=1 Tax=Teratosphaeria nubilosa TaxID=161662 RepID=A0A6G1KTC7_9PEZI|nr:putative MFS multidrug transporter [Teratosphaeria nubilosa]